LRIILGKIKAILFDLGFTLCTMHGISLEGYFMIDLYQKGISHCLSYLTDEEIIADDQKAQLLMNLIMDLRGDAWSRSRKDNREYKTDIIIEQALTQLYNIDFSQSLINHLSDLFHSEELKYWVPFDGTIATLKIFREKKYKLGVLSNFPYHPFLKKLLHKNELSGFFHTIHSSAEIGTRKPSQEAFQYALRHLECDNHPECCVMVGDEPWSDILGAHNVGMKTILIKREIQFPNEPKIQIKPDATINAISDLPNVLEKWEL